MSLKLLCFVAAETLLLASLTLSGAAAQQSHLGSKRVENDFLKLEFVAATNVYTSANVYARQGKGWVLMAVWKPLFQIATESVTGSSWVFHPTAVQLKHRSITFSETAHDPAGVSWQLQLKVQLEANSPLARISYEWTPSQESKVKGLFGPNLYVGEGTAGDGKSWGLFPGLEFLYGAEPSSNPRDFAAPLADRRTPHPNKITIPMMALTLGPDSQRPPGNAAKFFSSDSAKDQPFLLDAKLKCNSGLQSDVTVGLFWDPLQRWDGEHQFPSARFSSPNQDEGQPNHRLALFLPSAPDFVPEHSGAAAKEPFSIAAGKTLKLSSTLFVVPGPATAALHAWLGDNGGLPKPNPWPRTFQQELDVCRAGFLKTLWNEQAQGWRHCIDWAAQDAPGFAALLWLDSQIAANPAARASSRDRVELVVKKMLNGPGAGVFSSQAACHILQWEFPFLYGHLAEGFGNVEQQVEHLIQTQRADGGWVFEPGPSQKEKDLGQAGDSVLGTCANRAATLLRYARITGATNALAAGERALRYMESFRVPRGGQTWECPMYEPDILAAGYAIRAYHDGFRATGNPRWLHDAVYWAETGVPFVYLWTLPERPMMLGATIPVFGSTFYTHNWLGVPVQWNGLVYSYHLFHLAEELQNTKLPPTDSPLPLALKFSPADWKRVVELITVSAEYQQFADGEKIGAYPDSISNFTVRNGAFINPEDILVNVLALNGHDPDIKTARAKTARGQVVVSSGARVERLKVLDTKASFELEFFPGESSHTLINGFKPKEILVAGSKLPRNPTPLKREPGWWWDEKTQRAYLTVLHNKPKVQVQIR